MAIIDSFPKVEEKANFGLFRAGYIYVLKCPLSGKVRYVGKTFSPKRRFYEHLNVNQNIRSKRNNWIKSLHKKNLKPVIEIIDDCDEFNWEEKEKGYIKMYKACGANLVNMTDGGEAGALNFRHKEDVKRLISEKMKSRVVTLQHAKNVSNALKLKFKEDPVFRKLANETSANNLKKITEEQKIKARTNRINTFRKKQAIKLCDFYKILSEAKTRKTYIKTVYSEYNLNKGQYLRIRKRFVKKIN